MFHFTSLMVCLTFISYQHHLTFAITNVLLVFWHLQTANSNETISRVIWLLNEVVDVIVSRQRRDFVRLKKSLNFKFNIFQTLPEYHSPRSKRWVISINSCPSMRQNPARFTSDKRFAKFLIAQQNQPSRFSITFWNEFWKNIAAVKIWKEPPV